jgi:hypothetical protein
MEGEGFLKSVGALMDRYGRGAACLVVAMLLLLLWPTEEVDNTEFAKSYALIKLVQPGLVFIFLFVGALSFFTGAISSAFRLAGYYVFPRVFRGPLQVIAWEGVGDEAVVRPYRRNRVAVLEYVRGIDRASHLRYDQRLFDVLVADVEILSRHNMPENRGRLIHLGDEGYKSLWDQIWARIYLTNPAFGC